MIFEPFSFGTLKKYIPWIRRSPYYFSDLSVGALFMWIGQESEASFCLWNNTFVIRRNIADQVAFTWPYGDDPAGMISELMTYTRENDLPLRFYPVSEDVLQEIKNDPRFEKALSGYRDEWSDYIYSYEDVVSFAGRKYATQRNHINKYKRLYGEPQISFMTPEDIPSVSAFLDSYQTEHPDPGILERRELRSVRRLLECYEDLGLWGACLKVNGKIVAFSIGEIMGDMLIIHVEKALKLYEGAYPVMFQGFVRLVGANCPTALSYVNREDDSGDPGLRYSKQQYHPVRMEEHYLVNLFSPVAGVVRTAIGPCGSVVLTAIRESDKQAYLRLNTDVENNIMWGYDYREDPYINGEPDEETFYEGVMFDQALGDSLNFAIRLKEDGDMIGETILWHFTASGRVEVGCRLFPEYQGHGYGRSAFAMTASYARNVLVLKPWAKCFVDNESSRRMITACGFEKTGEDGKYHYFQMSS